MEIRWFGGILLIGACAGIGNLYVRRLSKRVEQLSELYHCMLMLQGEIRYTATPLAEALTMIGKQGVIAELLLHIAESMEETTGEAFADIVRRIGTEKWSKTVLTIQDREAFFRLGDSLGRLDRTQQLLSLEYYLKNVQTELEEAKRIQKERSYLYRCLSILAGIFLTILMI